MPAATYALVPVEALSAGELGRVQCIYSEGFPPRLRAPFHLVTGQREPGEQALALMSGGDGGEPVGFAVLRSLGGTGWMFLRYFVVDQARRGQGLGGVLWRQLTARLREEGATTGLRCCC